MAAKMEKLNQLNQPSQQNMLTKNAQEQNGASQAQAARNYTPSANVMQAKQNIDTISASRPGAYKSSYSQQLSTLYDKIMNRPKFSYDLNGDMLYQQYKDQYQTAGKQAMMDTMGQAAALTGGYGSSYASTAGNQAYQGYLQKLNDIIPSLYDRAYNAYQDEGTALQQKYGLAQNADATDYGRWQDTLSQWNTDRDYASNWYNNEYSRDYSAYQDDVSQEQYNQNMAYDTAIAMIKAGAMPSAASLAAAGISQEDAQAYYNALHQPKTSGGGGTKKTTKTPMSSGVTNGTLGGLTFEEINLIDNADKAKQVAAKTGYTRPKQNTTTTAKPSLNGMSKFQANYIDALMRQKK